MYQWYVDGSPSDNYEYDFFNSSNTGALETSLNSIEQAGNSYEFTGFFWFQGEGDTGSVNSIEKYESRFLGMLEQLNNDLNQGNQGGIDFTMAIIDANPLYDKPAGRDWEQIELLRDVQMNLADTSEFGSYVDSRGYQRTDAFHLTPQALEAIGVEMANTFISTHVVPLPTSVIFFMTGIMGMFGFEKHRRKQYWS